MGVKGLYSCLKSYSVPIQFQECAPLTIGLDAYPFLYKFKQDLDSCLRLFQGFVEAGHSLVLYVDGNPPKEKLEELASRRHQKEQAYKQAEALRVFLQDPEKSGTLDAEAREILQQQIRAYEERAIAFEKRFVRAFFNESKKN